MLRFGNIYRLFRTRLLPISLAIFTLGLWALYSRAFPTPDTVRPDTRPRTEEGLQRFRSEEPRDALVVLLGMISFRVFYVSLYCFIHIVLNLMLLFFSFLLIS
jgi:hypothetical protein